MKNERPTALVTGVGLTFMKSSKPPELFGVSEIELDLESELIILDESAISKIQITAEENDMRPFSESRDWS